MAGLLRQATYTTARLGVYNSLFEHFSGDSGQPPSFLTKVGIGLTAGIMGSFVGTPSEVCLIRMSSDGRLPPNERRNYSNAFNALYRIVKEEGVTTLWRGAIPTMTRAAVVNVSQLVSYSQAKEIFAKQFDIKDGIGLHFCASMISGLVTTINSMPVDIAKTRIQNMRIVDGKPEYSGVFLKHKEYEADKSLEQLRLISKQLELTNEKLKQTESEKENMNQILKKWDSDSKVFSALKDRNEMAITELQASQFDSTRKIASLETIVRSSNIELEAAKKSTNDVQAILSSAFKKLKTLSGDDSVNSTDKINLLIDKISTKLGKIALLELENNELKKTIDQSNQTLINLRSESGSIHNTFRMTVDEVDKLKRVCPSEREELAAENELLRKRTKAQLDQISHWKSLCDQKDHDRQSNDRRLREIDFELAALKTQANAFLNSLATSLSTVDDPCHVNENSVRCTATKRMDELAMTREQLAQTEKKLIDIQLQLSKNYEIDKQATKHLEEDKARWEALSCECDLLKNENNTLKMLKNAENDLMLRMYELVDEIGSILHIEFSVKVDESIHDCLGEIIDCLRGKDGCSQCQMPCRHRSRSKSPSRHSCCVGRASRSNSPKMVSFLEVERCRKAQCVLCDVSRSDPVEFVESPYRMLVRSCADWSDNDWRVLRSLCEHCLSQLHAEFKHQLLAAWEQLNGFRHQHQYQTYDGDQLQCLKNRFHDLEKENEKLKKKLENSDTSLRQENENLNKLLNEMDKARESQLKKIVHLERTLEVQTNSSKSRTKQLKGAQQLLHNLRNKQVKSSEFQDYVATMLGMDPRSLPPGSEVLILQRLYAVLSGSTPIIAPVQTPMIINDTSLIKTKQAVPCRPSLPRIRARPKSTNNKILNSSMESELIMGTKTGFICDRTQKY
ncbi:hypothetical protein Ciccas_004711 [Cichlidogyrus casuarinus]|uniref:Mitochondrial 2-oxoglutarate/malate carrier protein n=1 Tax=Cichlidogyrus casuarinus TaxID=1844966 RepID=A0ABD2QAQ0_9PLAT